MIKLELERGNEGLQVALPAFTQQPTGGTGTVVDTQAQVRWDFICLSESIMTMMDSADSDSPSQAQCSDDRDDQ